MDVWQDIAERYGFTPPELFRLLHERGHADPHGEAHLQLSDLLWLTPEQIRDWRFDPREIADLVPFALTTAEDLWCWRADLAEGADAPIAFCPIEDEVALIYAPDFPSFCYRQLLEDA